jgi:hypothetical protein
MNTAAFGVTPLGVTIARKEMEHAEQQQHSDESSQDLHQKKKKQRKQKQIITSTSWTTEEKTQNNASWLALVEGVTVYGLCLIVPSLLGLLFRLDWQEVELQVCLWSSWICWHVFGKVLPEPEPPLTLQNFVSPDTYLSDICIVLGLTLTMAFFRVLLVHWLVPNNLAPQQMEALIRCKSIHLLSKEYKESLTPREEMTARAVISWDSLNKELFKDLSDDHTNKLSLPLVPNWNDQKDNKEDDDDPNTPMKQLSSRNSSGDLGLCIDTPVHVKPILKGAGTSEMGGFLQSCGPSVRGHHEHNTADDDEDGLGYGNSDNEDDNINSEHDVPPQPDVVVGNLMTPPPSPPRQLQQEEEDPPSVWERRGSAASLAAAAAAAIQEEEDDDEGHHSHFGGDGSVDGGGGGGVATAAPITPTTPQHRLFAAPRYATAVFRLLYCTSSCIMAWYLFRDADFWPPYVGGSGDTKRCWDLSGSLALAKNLDSDFDHRNVVLRRFFLVQASYHLHSGAFHVASVLLLYFLKNGDDSNNSIGTSNQRNKNWASLLKALIHPRALLQHSLSLVFLSVSYVFSSLRRLGAIGMFALDMSSWALHLLQTCLNAPTESVLSQPRVIRAVWALLVLPSFLYFRFWVWPWVGYSAMMESDHWLAQLESTLVPGSALWFRRVFQVWMALWMGFHAIHFKRLVFHPHLQRIMTASSCDSVAQPSRLSQDSIFS